LGLVKRSRATWQGQALELRKPPLRSPPKESSSDAGTKGHFLVLFTYANDPSLPAEGSIKETSRHPGVELGKKIRKKANFPLRTVGLVGPVT